MNEDNFDAMDDFGGEDLPPELQDGPIITVEDDVPAPATTPEPDRFASREPSGQELAAREASERRMAAMEERLVQSNEAVARSVAAIQQVAQRPAYTPPPPQAPRMTPEEQLEAMQSNPTGFIAQLVGPALQAQQRQIQAEFQKALADKDTGMQIVVDHMNEGVLAQATAGLREEMDARLDKFGIPQEKRQEIWGEMCQRIAKEGSEAFLVHNPQTGIVVGHKLRNLLNDVLGGRSEELFQYGQENAKARARERRSGVFPSHGTFSNQGNDPMGRRQAEPTFADRMYNFMDAKEKRQGR